jgi:hypothetical protein
VPVVIITVPPVVVGPSDTADPSIPTWRSVGEIEDGEVELEFNAPVDIVSNAAVEVYRNGAYVTEVAYSPGLSKTFAKVDFGSPGTTGSIVQTGHDFEVTSYGNEIYYTADNYSAAAATHTGPLTFGARLLPFSSDGDFDKINLFISQNTAEGSKRAGLVIFSQTPGNGAKVEGRSSVNGGATDGGSLPGVTGGYATCEFDGTNANFYLSTTGEDRGTFVGTYQPNITGEFYFGGGGSNVAGISKTFEFDNFWYQVPGALSVTVSASDGDVFTLKARDSVGRRSASSVSVTAEEAAPVVSGIHNFPRIGAGVIGDPQGYPSSLWAQLAKHDVLFIGGDYESWPASYGSGMRHTICSGIKALNPDIKILQYVLWDSYRPDNLRYPTYDAAIIANGWALYVNGTSGTMANNFYNSAWKQVNPTSSTPTDGNGDRACGFFAKYALSQFTGGTTGNRSTALDGLMFDNTLWKPRTDGDYNRNGSSDSQNDSTVQTAWRTGEKVLYDTARSVRPDLIYAGNISDWPNAGGYSFNLADIAPLNQIPQGSFAEYILGTPGVAFGEWGGFTIGLNSYRYQMDGCAAPKLVMFVHNDMASNGIDAASGSLPAYQKSRYGLCMCLLDDGYYYAPRDHSYRSDSTNWFDEYWGGNLNTRGFLGQRVGSRPSAAYSGGVWVSEFENGYAICWPPGVTSSITLPVATRRLTGTQASSVNNGASIAAGASIGPPGGTGTNGLIVLKT